MPQVFLFAGPKGTGKTSTARIIGAMLNEPDNAKAVTAAYASKQNQQVIAFVEPTKTAINEAIFKGSSYLVQEMDAASHRGIDDVRALKERVFLPPTEGIMAVYILDEAHMLTTEAFNALLKLLEEPPAHAVFILATTELHKVPETIVSRCSVINFRKATEEELLSSLKNIADKQKINYENEALVTLARRADGSFRDAVKLLQLAVSAGEVTLAALEAQGSGSLQPQLVSLLQAVIAKDASQVAGFMSDWRTQNLDSSTVVKQLIQILHQSLYQGLKLETGDPLFETRVSHYLLQQLSSLSIISHEIVPLLNLEVLLLDIIFKAQRSSPDPVSTSGSGSPKLSATSKSAQSVSAPVSSPKKIVVNDSAAPESQIVTSSFSVSKTVLDSIPPAFTTDDTLSIPLTSQADTLITMWEVFVKTVAEQNVTLAAFLKSAKPALTDNKLNLRVFYKFHKEQLEQPKFMQLLQDCAEKMTGVRPVFECTVDNTTATTPTPNSLEGEVANLVSQVFLS